MKNFLSIIVTLSVIVMMAALGCDPGPPIICDYCHKEMSDPKIVGCAGNKKVDFPDKTSLRSVVATEGCDDCGVKSGGAHHPGCDQEKCPRCKGQLISCPCLRSKKRN